MISTLLRSTTTWAIPETTRRCSACCTQVAAGPPMPASRLILYNCPVYSIPNIFLPFFGGYFVDKFGVRITLFSTTALLTGGQAIFALGLSMKSWPVMLLGRVVYGFGGESLGVANSAVLAEWFKGKELAFAFGLNLSVARLGSVANNMISPALADSSSVVFALWFGVFLCGASLGCVFVFSPIDKAMDVLIAKNKTADDDAVTTLLLAGEDDDRNDMRKSYVDGQEEETKLSDVKKFPFSFWILVISCLVVYGECECRLAAPALTVLSDCRLCAPLQQYRIVPAAGERLLPRTTGWMPIAEYR